jgi:predicted Fe-S protein YdhL (DUF1289 family)
MNELQDLADRSGKGRHDPADPSLRADDFLDFNEFLDVADAAVEDMRLDGELQVASFHPDYQFADTDQNDISNYTNRAPYPILQLLREESIDRAVEAFPEAEAIFEKNIETMEALGHEGWDKLDVGPARNKWAHDLPERPDTPCVAVCSTTFDDVCRGCGRTVVEVAHWVSMTPSRRKPCGSASCRRATRAAIPDRLTAGGPRCPGLKAAISAALLPDFRLCVYSGY